MNKKMNARFFKMTAALLCLGIISFAQPKGIQRQIDKRGNTTFAVFSKDSVVPTSEAPGLLKKLQPTMSTFGAWKTSIKRKVKTDKNGYTHQFYDQYYKNILVEGGEFGVHSKDGKIEAVLGKFVFVGAMWMSKQNFPKHKP
jgi:Zn-dependent metalloprotease